MEKMPQNSSICRIFYLKSLHNGLEFFLGNAKQYTLAGLECETSDHQRFLLPLMKTYYIADILECEELPSVKRRRRSSSPSHCSIIQKEDLKRNKCVMVESLNRSFNHFLDYKTRTVIAQQKVSQLSLLPIFRALHDFPFVEFHETVNICTIFRFEPLPYLSLGISKLLKEYLFNRLSDAKKS